MRLRFWIGLAAVLLIAAGSVAAALIVRADDSADFDEIQRDEAIRAAHQAEAVAALSIGQLASAAAFFQAEETFSRARVRRHRRAAARAGGAERDRLHAAAARTPSAPPSNGATAPRSSNRAPDGPRAPARGADYFPIVYAVSGLGTVAPVGYDLGRRPERGPFLRRARDSGKPVATPPVQLLLGGTGINVYRPVYRDGAPTATVAAAARRPDRLRRRRLPRRRPRPGGGLDRRRRGRRAAADRRRQPWSAQQGELDDAATAPIHIADRTWLLVVRDPNRPDVSLPLLLAVVGISLAALLGALILAWSRNERMQELQRQASLDPLTGLKNRRRFEEDLRMAMARGAPRGHDRGGADARPRPLQAGQRHAGHPAGDRMIEEIADVLRRRTRESDVLARLGGDEFAIVLPRCSPAEARVVAEVDRRPRSASTAPPTTAWSRSPPASASRCSATTRAPASSR